MQGIPEPNEIVTSNDPKEEKRLRAEHYRAYKDWSEHITSLEAWENRKEQAVDSFRSGEHFLKKLGSYSNIDPQTVAVLLHVRQRWIEEYRLTTALEILLLDAALISYRHMMKLDDTLANVEKTLETDLFFQDEPSYYYERKGTQYDFENPKYRAGEMLMAATRHLMPMREQAQKMFLRSIKALRDLKRMNMNLNIERAGYVNMMGQTDVHVGRRTRKDTVKKARKPAITPSSSHAPLP